jgi:hypothetical protein
MNQGHGTAVSLLSNSQFSIEQLEKEYHIASGGWPVKALD